MSTVSEAAAVRDDGTSRESIIRQLQGKASAELRGAGDGAPFCLLDFPDHRNVGDSAIWLGEVAFFREHRQAEPRYVSSMAAFSEAALRASVPEGPIFIHGGGNFGDLYPRHQEFREHLLERFPDREIIQLPQSIHFQDSQRVAGTARAIARHRKFRFFVRDQSSYEFAVANFDCEVRLCPDLALFLGALDRKRLPEVDVLYLLRTDQERALERRPGRQAPPHAWPTGWWRTGSPSGRTSFSASPVCCAGAGGPSPSPYGRPGTMPPPEPGWSAVAGSSRPAGSSSQTDSTATS